MYNNGKGELITRTEYLRWKYRNNQKVKMYLILLVHIFIYLSNVQASWAVTIQFKDCLVGSFCINTRKPQLPCIYFISHMELFKIFQMEGIILTPELNSGVLHMLVLGVLMECSICYLQKYIWSAPYVAYRRTCGVLQIFLLYGVFPEVNMYGVRQCLVGVKGRSGLRFDTPLWDLNGLIVPSPKTHLDICSP